jgi:hypothetical protein
MRILSQLRDVLLAETGNSIPKLNCHFACPACPACPGEPWGVPREPERSAVERLRFGFFDSRESR